MATDGPISAQESADASVTDDAGDEGAEDSVRPVLHRPLEDPPYRLEKVELRALQVDVLYQAPVSAEHLKEMRDNWNPQLLLPIVVNRRVDGRLMVIDGQHRMEAAQQIYGPSVEIEAMVYDGMTVSEEAQLYYRLNTAVRRKTLRAIFHARLAAGEPTALSIKAVVEECGFVLSVNEHQGTPVNGIRAVGGLDLFCRVGGVEHLRAMLTILRDAWGDHTEGETAVEVLWALHMMLLTHAGQFDRASLVERLKEEEPKRIIAAGRRFRYNKRMSQRGYYTYKALVEIYNSRRSDKNKLDVVGTIEEFRKIAKQTRLSVPMPLGAMGIEAVRTDREEQDAKQREPQEQTERDGNREAGAAQHA